MVGDRVLWQPTLEGSGEGLIVQVEERRNLLYRQDEWRSKSFAANLDQMLVWIAVEPVFSEAQLTRTLPAALLKCTTLIFVASCNLYWMQLAMMWI